ncbi:hypothetical protein GCM10009630_48550 [Kribbella jejuensis]|uniref:Uncharacterized protein n=1 Tax=Kribbella jejuensis TaxID=236068 RepID=A0A542E7E6_9ACTN|nr:hypothetical protein [Kribbella jejuensis]TQJ11245.1 hypothetical protein FB475_4154 [Kribbella jejuensis]
MQFVTIGKSEEYLRLTAVRWPSDKAPEQVPREKRRYLNAEVRMRELTASARLDLWSDYSGLALFFDQVVTNWPQWENSSATWGKSSALQLEIYRGPRPALGPDHLIVWIKLQNGGMRRRLWKVETSIVVSPDELSAFARDLHRLTD